MIVGVVGDTHLPFGHPQYLRFCRDTFRKHKVQQVVHIGDVVDSHAMSFHEHDPAGHSAEDEAALAAKELKRWQRAFPKALVCIGNHDERHQRAARRAGVPPRFLRDYGDLWGTDGWEWEFTHHIDGVQYTHGTGTSGKDAAFNLAVNNRCSTVIGHVHSYASVKWHTNKTSSIFGMNVGCGIDCRAYAFAYGRDFAVRPVLSCGIVKHGREAQVIPMPCGPGEPYSRKVKK